MMQARWSDWHGLLGAIMVWCANRNGSLMMNNKGVPMTGKFLKPAVAGLLFAAAGVFSTTQVLAADNVVRHDIPDSDFPVAEGVEVGPDATVLYLSGNVPPVVDESADDQTTAAYGNTETQTRNALKAIAGNLDALGYGIGEERKSTRLNSSHD